MALPANGANVKLGKGSLLLNKLTNAGASTGFAFAGNASAVAVQSNVTKVELYSSTQRSAPLLASDITRLAYTLTATLNEQTLDNLSHWLLGTRVTRQQAMDASVTKSFEGEEVVAGRYLDLGARRVTDLAMTRDGSIELVAGTDYVLYAEFGIVLLVAGGAVQDGDDIDAEFAQPALTIDAIRIARDAAPKVHLLFLCDDANQDGAAARDRLEIWKASLAPEGELQFVSEDYTSYQLSIGVLDDGANHPDDPYGTLERVRA